MATPRDSTLTVVFAHGKESGPWGTKIRTLAEVAAELGCKVVSVDFTAATDPDARVDILKEALTAIEGPLFLVGSSMGAYVVTVASADLRPVALLLLAPAFHLPGYAEQNPVPHADRTVVVHGWHDQVVPVDNALHFSRRYAIELHLLADGHQLLDSLPQIKDMFRQMLHRLLRIC